MLDGAAARIAHLLEDKGLQPGDRVGLMLPNVPYFPAIYYGDPARRRCRGADERAAQGAARSSFYLEDSGAKLLFAWHGFAEEAEQGASEAGAEIVSWSSRASSSSWSAATAPSTRCVDRDADDTAVILYTSGTTGTAQGRRAHPREPAASNCDVTSNTLGEFDASDVLLGALPLFHSFGQTCTMNSAWPAARRSTMLPRFDPEKALEIIERDRVTVFQGVPTMYNAMLHADARRRDRRVDAAPVHVRRRRHRRSR